MIVKIEPFRPALVSSSASALLPSPLSIRRIRTLGHLPTESSSSKTGRENLAPGAKFRKSPSFLAHSRRYGHQLLSFERSIDALLLRSLAAQCSIDLPRFRRSPPRPSSPPPSQQLFTLPLTSRYCSPPRNPTSLRASIPIRVVASSLETEWIQRSLEDTAWSLRGHQSPRGSNVAGPRKVVVLARSQREDGRDLWTRRRL